MISNCIQNISDLEVGIYECYWGKLEQIFKHEVVKWFSITAGCVFYCEHLFKSPRCIQMICNINVL